LAAACGDVCSYNFTTIEYWQQTAFADLVAAKYRTQSNCSTSSCDFAGGIDFAYLYRGPGDCRALDYSCGAYSFVVDFCFYSDANLKKGVETIKNSLPKLMKLEAVEYDWNDKLNPNMYQYFVNQQRLHTIGLIAQNVRLYFPEVVGMNDEGFYYIDYQKLNAVLVEGIKSLQEKIDDIDVELNEIELKLN
jgi:hypothetical protein